MFIVLLRTIFLYFLVVIVMRLMGKRQIGELQPYEFVITIMISDLAALPMQDTRLPLLLGIIPIITLLFVKTLLSQLQLKSQLARRVLEGEPCIMVYKGKVNFKGLKKQQINLDELMEELRLAGHFDLEEIEYAILENNGQLSFLTSYENNYNILNSSPKSNNKTTNQTSNTNTNTNTNTNRNSVDLNDNRKEPSIESRRATRVPRLPVIYVLDGRVNKNSLTTSGKSRAWIEQELKDHKIYNIDNVLLAMTDTTGKFIYQLHDEYNTTSKALENK
ncbi:MAG: YetF domain-containing protein [Clostridium sp.]